MFIPKMMNSLKGKYKPIEGLKLSVKGIVRRPDGKFLLIRRSQLSKANPGFWEIPGGKMDAGETVDASLRREVKEETGLDLKVEKLLGAYESIPSSFNIIYLAFLCNCQQ